MSLEDELRSRLARKARVKNARPSGGDTAAVANPLVTSAPAAATAGQWRSVPERRYAGIAWAVAVGAVAVALIVNWIASPVVVGGSLNAGAGTSGADGLPGATAVLNLPTQPSKMLPSQVVAYEVIESHAVPGSNGSAAEAIYQTYNMNLTIQVAITNYAHVEGFATSADAQAALSQLMAKYPLNQSTRLVGPVQPARTGYSNDQGGYVVAWAKGRYVTFVKTFFADHIPAQKRDFLQAQGEPVVLAVEEFERTGQQGAAANAEIYKNQPKAPAGKKSTTPTTGPSGFGGEILGAP